MKLVIPLNLLYWSIHIKDESKRGSVFAFIFGLNGLWRCGVTASFGVSFPEMKCNGMTSFTELMDGVTVFEKKNQEVMTGIIQVPFTKQVIC